MIELNQLRIGNLVKEYNEVKKVSAIYPHGVDFEEGNFGVCPPQDMNPIPLTEAVLRAVGYLYFDNGKDWGYTNGTGIRVSDYNDEYFYLDILDQQGITLEIKTLHQLQNLIFALTGKELEINMEELKKAVNE